MPVMKIEEFNLSDYSGETKFVLDTNVLYYVHSGYYLPDSHESIAYSNLLQSLIMQGCNINVSTLSVQELLFGIETKEYKMYCKQNDKNPYYFSKKDYRKISAERNRIKEKEAAVLLELSVYNIDDGIVKDSFLKTFVSSFSQHKMDPIDYVLVNNYDVVNTVFVSADRDYQSLPSINVIIA